MTRRYLIAALLLAPAVARPSTISWIGADGNFSDPAHWDAGRVPGSGGLPGILDVALINTLSPVSVTYDLTDSFAELSIGLSGAGLGQFNTLSIASTGLTVGLEQIGALGAAAVNQSGGFNTSKTELRLGQGASDLGSYTLTGGSLSVNQVLYLGNAGSGVFSQSGGTNTVSGGLQIGFASTANGSYLLNGTGSLTVFGGENIGASGIGSFNQSDGTHQVSGGLSLAANAGSNGTYTLSNGLLLINTTNEIVGNSGAGVFNQSGGTNDIGHGTPANLILGLNAGSTGTYTLNGSGSVTVEAGGQVTIGAGGTGIFNQAGGTHSVAGNLVIGDQAGATGTYNLSLGSLSAGSQEIIGVQGTGTFSQSGGTHSIVNDLTLGGATGAAGTYNLSLGSLSVGNSETIGLGGAGTFNQTGGAHSVTNSLTLGEWTGSTGTYNLSQGSLSVKQGEAIGLSGTGMFTQSGGTHSVAGLNTLALGELAGSSGAYQLSGGTLSVNQEFVGVLGSGAITQSGGTNTTGQGGLYLGVSAGGAGQYTLSGNALLSASAELIGAAGSGTFVQTGGTNVVSSNLNLGATQGSAGTYNLSGGSLTDYGQFVVGGFGFTNNVPNPGGTGVLIVSGTGVLTALETIAVANTPGSSINLEGGTINAPAIYTGGDPSRFNWTGGTLNLTSHVILDAADSNTWTGGVFGPSLNLGAGQTLQVEGDEVIGTIGGFSLTLNDGAAHIVAGDLTLNPGGTITLSDNASLSASNFVLSGGTFNGTLQNTTRFQYTAGQFNGRLINLGAAILGSNFTAANGIENDTSLNLSSGQTWTVNGAGLDNFGTLAITGGRITGNGPVVNDVGGLMTVSGAAAVTSAFTNLGALQINGSLTLSSGGINSGVLTIAAGGGIRGDAFTNAGTLTLAGGGISSVSTTNAAGGVISGTGGIGGTFTNAAGGIIQIASGNTLTIANAWSNAGLVNMQGGTLGPAAVANSGVIQGLGIVGGAVANSGTLRASGGELDIAGAGSINSAGGQIQVQSGATMLFVPGLAQNAGTIALSGGTFDNANTPLLNTGNIIGSGTVRTGGITNQGNMNFADASTSVFGSVTTQNAGDGAGNVQVTSNTTTFFGLVTLGADTTFTATQSTARFLAGFINNGTYISDPSTSVFTNLTVNGTGTLIGGSGDTFQVSGNLVNQSTENTTFDLSQSLVDLTGVNDVLYWVGADDGDLYSGYLHNFAIGTLELAAGTVVGLGDGTSTTRPSAGLYVGTLLLDGEAGATTPDLRTFILTHLINTNAGDVLNIYYDPLQSGNAYLEGLTYQLGGGGFLTPVETAATPAPEPRSTAMLLVLAMGFVISRWRSVLWNR